MINFDNIKEHNPNQPQLPDHAYIILITGGSDQEKPIHYSIWLVINKILINFFYALKIHLKQNINS